MNDRFKFRIWETDQKIMKEVTQITLDKDQTGSMCDVKGKVTAHLVYQPHYILMQSTGLKDKNGKLIYEGDIVKDEHNAWHYVKWVYDSWQLFPCTQNNYTKCIVDDDIEVIGNIYENKELLESEEE